MVIPFTLLFGALGYLFYKSKKEIALVEKKSLDLTSYEDEDNDLYKDLEDLFI